MSSAVTESLYIYYCCNSLLIDFSYTSFSQLLLFFFQVSYSFTKTAVAHISPNMLGITVIKFLMIYSRYMIVYISIVVILCLLAEFDRHACEVSFLQLLLEGINKGNLYGTKGRRMV